jgi:hypothetical protein
MPEKGAIMDLGVMTLARPKKKTGSPSASRKRGRAFIFYITDELRERIEARRTALEREQRDKLGAGFTVRVAAADVVRSLVERGLVSEHLGGVPALPETERRALVDRVLTLVQKKGEVGLAFVRRTLAGVFREHQDVALLELERAGNLILRPAPELAALTDEDRAAAIRDAKRGLLVVAAASKPRK